MSLFEQVAKVRKGVALSMATRDGLCSICHVRLRPQVFQQVRHQRHRRAVRQLPADPLLGATASAHPAAGHDREVSSATANVDGGSRGVVVIDVLIPCSGPPCSGGLPRPHFTLIIRVVSKFLITFALTAALAARLAAAEPAALEQQNTFVKTHCAVCHSDRANNGGLSLEGFDAAVAAPSLAAMMLSKITSGTALATVTRRRSRRGRRHGARSGLRKGAVDAAGIGVPGKRHGGRSGRGVRGAVGGRHEMERRALEAPLDRRGDSSPPAS